MQIYPERLHHVGGAAAGGYLAIAVLGHPHPCSGGHDGGGSRDIESAARVSPGSTGVDQAIASRAGFLRGGKGRCGGANGFGKADYFLNRLTLHVQGNQQAGDLGVGTAAGEDFFHETRGLGAGERMTLIRDAVDGFGDHGEGRGPSSRGLYVMAGFGLAPDNLSIGTWGSGAGDRGPWIGAY